MSAVTQRIPTMSGVFYVYLLFWCLRTSADYIGADLTPPENLTMITLNTNYTLSWGWHQSPAESLSVNFTTQYMAEFRLKYKKKSQIWHTACEKTSQRSCDLTDFDLFYRGIYLLRVQADINGRLSDWSLKKFCPEKDAALGPPKKVNLSPAGSDLDIYISHPVTSTNNSMKDNLPNLYYHILYWESSADTQALRTSTLSSSADMLTLTNLKPWTWYCVSIRSCDDFYDKRSSFTPPHCMQTEGATPWWQIVGYFLVSLSICFLVMLLSIYSSFWCYKTVKATFYPSVQLPSPFQYLCDSSGSDIPRLLTPDSDSELLCDKVTICPEPLVLEINDPAQEALVKPPSGLEPDSSGRPNSQDSSGRRDSGVYSTGSSSGNSIGNSSGHSSGHSSSNSSGHSSGHSSGKSIGNSSGHSIGHSSSLQPPNTKQSSVGGGVSGQGPLDLEQVKMQDMARGLRTELVIADEGIVDMCV